MPADDLSLVEAIRILVQDDKLGDFVYQIRANAVETDPKFNGNSWDHPRVARFSSAVTRLEKELENHAH